MSAPLLSVLLTSHADPDGIDGLFEKLLSFRMAQMEILFVDDATGQGALNRFESLSKEQPESRFVPIRNALPAGRAACLTRALQESSGELIWCPLKADKVNQVVLAETLRRAAAEPFGFWLLDGSLPGDLHEWLDALSEGELPADERFLFNRKSLLNEEGGFRPGLGPLTAAELAYQLWRKKGYQTLDAFFVFDRLAQSLPTPSLQQEFLFAMIRTAADENERAVFLDRLGRLRIDEFSEPDDGEGLDAARLMAEQDARLALEMVNRHLKRHPADEEAVKLKVTLLERLRRHVEAAELKHSLQKRRDHSDGQQPPLPLQQGVDSEYPNRLTGSGEEQATRMESASEADRNGGRRMEADGEIRSDAGPEGELRREPAAANPEELLSIIIPTAGNGKTRLESCLVRLDEITGPNNCELIIVDNASIDDTFQYLESLETSGFMSIQTLTHPVNMGFAASVNRAMEIAKGDFILILHNDLLPKPGLIDELMAILKENPTIGAAGPLLTRTRNPEQRTDTQQPESGRFRQVHALDSCCMMMRRGDGPQFDEAYGIAWFEGLDYCRQRIQRGETLAVATAVLAEHLSPSVSMEMGLAIEPERSWECIERYHTKWGDGPDLAFPPDSEFPEILKGIPLPPNPLNPPGYWLDQIDALFTDELKTEIHNKPLDAADLLRLIRILIIADKREFLRQMESRAETAGIAMPRELLEELIRFYYQRTIYSRCRLYLSSPEADGDLFDLYRLRIAVREKEIGPAIELLNALMGSYPCHPELYRLAADIHLLGDNREEAESFLRLAAQLEPEQTSDEEAFEIKY